MQEQPYLKPNLSCSSEYTALGSSKAETASSNIREVTFNRADSGLSIVIPVKINNTPVHAVVDSAAQVTVLGNKFFNMLNNPPKIEEHVKLKGAGHDHHMTAGYAKDVCIQIGGQVYKWNVYVAPITDDFILGLDFMVMHKAVVDLEHNTFAIDHHQISAILKKNKSGETYQVSRVFLKNSVVIPPYSVALAESQLDNLLDDTYLLQPRGKQKTLVPYSVLKPQPNQKGMVCLVNDTNSQVTLKEKTYIGTAEAIDSVSSQEEDGSLEEFMVRSVKVMNSSTEEDMLDIVNTIPAHLRDLYSRSVENVTQAQKKLIANTLIEFEDVFSKTDTDIGCFDLINHSIDTGDARPIKQRMRRTPLGFEQEEWKHLTSMLNCGVIQPSMSEWASPPVLVRKKDGGVRWCIDYRALNNVTKKDVFPLPLIEECIDTLSGTEFFSTLDMSSGYWQINLNEADRHKTAFITKYGLFEHTRMGFGLCNAPATFQRAVQLVLRGLTWKDVLAYLDDVIVVGSSFEHHLKNIGDVLLRFRQHNLKLKPKKCILFQREVKFLGKIVSGNGISVNPDNVSAVANWPVPKSTKDVEKFLGFINYHRDHIKDCGKTSECLYQLTGKKPFIWNSEHDQAFKLLKEALISAPVLAYPKPDDPFILDTDASNNAVGAELIQIQDGVARVICYGSFVLTPQQRNYCTTRKELLAVVRFTRQFRHYLLGRKFTVRTDHNSLTWLMRFKMIEGQLARWLEELSQYDMEIAHRPGKKHGNADALSRLSDELDYCNCYHAGCNLESLPCGGCKYCTHVQKKWSKFEDDVDDVVPLALRTIEIEEPTTFWGPGYSKEQLRLFQLEDSDLGKLISWLESDQPPSSSVLSLSSPAVKYYWLNRKQLVMKDGLLFYRWEKVAGSKLLFVVPRSLKEEILNSCHDIKASGHMGQKKTLARLKNTFHWYKMSQESQCYVASCSACSASKKATVRAKGSLGSYHVGAPMERVHIDILGPLQVSRRGNRYILMIVDQFTKWVECIPLPVQSAEMIAKAVVDQVLSRFGCPIEIHTDQGRNFDSVLFKQLCDLLEINKTRTTPYRPCSNGQVERFNRTLLQTLRCYVRDKPDTWDEHLSQLAGSLRSTVNRQTGFTPNQMMLGREVVHPIELMLGTSEMNLTPTQPAPYVQELRETLEKTHNLARSSLQSAQVRQKRDYDVKLSITKYGQGDLVYKIDSATKVGVSSKLRPVWKGPYLVTKVITPMLYRIKDRKSESVIHHDRLKLCRDRNIPLWMRRMRHNLLYPSQQNKEKVKSNFILDDDLNLDVLFQDNPGNEDTEPAVAVGSDGDLDQERDSQEEEKEMTLPVVSRRGRIIKQPKYLDDYSQ